MMFRSRVSTIALGALMSLLPAGSRVGADTHFVDGQHPFCSDVTGTPFCTVQAALDAAAFSGDVIEVASGVYVENLQVLKNITIRGAGPEATFLDGGAIGTTVVNDAGTDLVLEDLAVVNGSGFFGGGIEHRWEFLRLHNVTVAGSHATAGGGLASLHAILDMEDSRILDNTSDAQGGGVYVSGGSAVILRSLIDGNETLATGVGGGIAVDNADLLVKESTLADNRSATNGGGISGYGFTLDRCTVVGNWCLAANCRGGGVQAGPEVSLLNTTISSNFASHGAGITASSSELRINNVTITLNTAWLSGGGVRFLSVEPTISNSVIANNFAVDCAGSLISDGHNLIEETSGCSISGEVASDLYGVDPQLLPLDDYGGPTFTHALARTSPAVDQGSAEVPGTSPSACETHDQRGVTRPRGSQCDIGSSEFFRLFADGFESGDTTAWATSVP